MARGVNKVILVGLLGGDPEVRYMPNGNAVTNITLATTDSWKDKETGQKQERTEWHRVVFFGRLAEVAGEYLRKGSQIYVEGALRTRKWKDQSGQDRYTTEVVVDMKGVMQMLGGNAGGSAGQAKAQPAAQPQQTPKQGRTNDNGTQASPHATPMPSPQGNPPPVDDFDDDIPFENPYKGLELVV